MPYRWESSEISQIWDASLSPYTEKGREADGASVDMGMLTLKRSITQHGIIPWVHASSVLQYIVRPGLFVRQALVVNADDG